MVHGLETMEKQNAVACEQPRIKKVVVANCMGTGDQAIYVDGEFVERDSTIYAFTIVEAVGGANVPFTLRQHNVEDAPDPWPTLLSGLPTESL